MSSNGMFEDDHTIVAGAGRHLWFNGERAEIWAPAFAVTTAFGHPGRTQRLISLAIAKQMVDQFFFCFARQNRALASSRAQGVGNATANFPALGSD
jgi:hypothetical protein